MLSLFCMLLGIMNTIDFYAVVGYGGVNGVVVEPLVTPQLMHLVLARRFAEVQVRIVRQSVNVVGDRAAGGALVKQAQGHIAVLQRAGQNIQPGLAANALAGLAQRVLVNVDQVFVGDNFKVGFSRTCSLLPSTNLRTSLPRISGAAIMHHREK